MSENEEMAGQPAWVSNVTKDDLVQIVLDLTGSVTALGSAIVKVVKHDDAALTKELEKSGARVDKVLELLSRRSAEPLP